MVHRQLFNALVELALQIVSLFLQFLLFLAQSLQLVFALRDFADVTLDELFLLVGLAQRAQVLAHPLLISGYAILRLPFLQPFRYLLRAQERINARTDDIRAASHGALLLWWKFS